MPLLNGAADTTSALNPKREHAEVFVAKRCFMRHHVTHAALFRPPGVSKTVVDRASR
jgi:hypothetical protein